MKKYVINFCLDLIKKNKYVSESELAIIKYGLEGIYLTITKTAVISIIAIATGYFKEMVIFLIIFGILRTPSCGLHAKKSWMCLISSIFMFNVLPVIANKTIINIYLKFLLGIIGIILIYLYSPADTYKKPIINKKRRKNLKIISTLISTLYFLLSIIIKNNFINNCFIFSIILQNILISPVTYKLFKLPYNNYINYLKKHPELNNL